MASCRFRWTSSTFYQAIGHGKRSVTPWLIPSLASLLIPFLWLQFQGSGPPADLQTVHQGRKKRTIEYLAIKSVEKSQKSKILQEVSHHFAWSAGWFVPCFCGQLQLARFQISSSSVRWLIGCYSYWVGCYSLTFIPWPLELREPNGVACGKDQSCLNALTLVWSVKWSLWINDVIPVFFIKWRNKLSLWSCQSSILSGLTKLLNFLRMDSYPKNQFMDLPMIWSKLCGKVRY